MSEPESERATSHRSCRRPMCGWSSPAGAAAGPWRRPSMASTWTSRPARSSRWSASPAAARPRWPGRCWGWSGRRRGEVRFAGQPLSYRSGALRGYRRSVQLVLQDPTGSLNPRHTVYEAIAEGVRIHRLDNEEVRVADALARCGMRPPERFFQRYPHELSGGQRQRVVIAGALVLEPSVLVADEPVASLDASVRGEILSLLLKLRDELGLAALVVTHDLGLAWNIADRLAVMYLGRIVEVGTPEQVFADPRHPYTQGPDVRPARVADRRRSCSPGSRLTRRESRPAAGSTRAARNSPRARRPVPGRREVHGRRAPRAAIGAPVRGKHGRMSPGGSGQVRRAPAMQAGGNSRYGNGRDRVGGGDRHGREWPANGPGAAEAEPARTGRAVARTGGPPGRILTWPAARRDPPRAAELGRVRSAQRPAAAA